MSDKKKDKDSSWKSSRRSEFPKRKQSPTCEETPLRKSLNVVGGGFKDSGSGSEDKKKGKCVFLDTFMGRFP